jgi:uncharacterized protein YjbI with pentapeptide repeats
MPESPLDILRGTVEDWNRWRSGRPAVDLRLADLSRLSLAGANLSGCTLVNADLTGTDLRGADLSRAALSGASFTRARLRGANFSGADFWPPQLSASEVRAAPQPHEIAGEWMAAFRVSLRECDAREAQFTRTDLRLVEFVDADLRGATFRYAQLSQVDLHWANLQGADLRDADLRGANLAYTNLANADLRRADLLGADVSLAHFPGANLFGANLRDVKFRWLDDASELRNARNLLLAYFSADLAGELEFPDAHNENVGKLDFRAYNLEGARLESADFRGASFENTRCAGASFRGAVLAAANLRRADLRGADLEGADLRHADLFAADLRGARLADASLNHANLQRARLEGVVVTADQVKAAANHMLSFLDADIIANLGLPKDHNERLEANDLREYDLSRANLRRCDLSGVSLVRANLAAAQLNEARLCHANLESATLVGANAVKADFTGANLAGTILREGDFCDADLRDIQVLSTQQLAGTNVSGAKLPAAVGSFEALQSIKESSENARKIFLSMLLLSAYSWLTIAATKDAALLTNTGQMQLPIIQTQIPIAWFYWVTPLFLLGVFLYCHFYLQNLWEELAQLPAIFPDGRPLHQRVYPWLVNSIARAHFLRLRSDRGLLSYLQYWTTIVLTWWVVPATELLFWIRYLPRHEWVGTTLTVITTGVAVAGATFFQRLARSTLEGRQSESDPVLVRQPFKAAAATLAPSAVVVGVLAVFSVGAIQHGPGHRAVDPRSWVRSVLGTLHIADAARLAEEDVSARPATWQSDRPDFDQVKGARLASRNLRNASARGAFLVKADLTGANLEFADLRNADLRRAVLSGARLGGANLTGAKLEGANLQDCVCQNAIGLQPVTGSGTTPRP